MSELMTIEQAAEFVGTSPRTIRSWRQRGIAGVRLEYQWRGRVAMLSEQNIAEFLERSSAAKEALRQRRWEQGEAVHEIATRKTKVSESALAKARAAGFRV